jgi:hypothetical protein
MKVVNVTGHASFFSGFLLHFIMNNGNSKFRYIIRNLASTYHKIKTEPVTVTNSCS